MDKETRILKEAWVRLTEKEYIPGGMADHMTLEDIFMKHEKNYPDLTMEKLKQQHEWGIDIEKEEHSENPNIAGEIAKDHLSEYPYYYTTLKQMEDDWNK